MLIADAGRAKGLGDARPVMGVAGSMGVVEEGCWRTQKTNVLLRTRLEH
jgi:hypothetical protein